MALQYRIKTRKQQGGMLIEVMVATLLLGVITAGLVSLVVINNAQSQRLLNKVDSLNDARQVIERIGRDWRMARSVGDLYGPYPVPSEDLIQPGTARGPTANPSVVNSNAVNIVSLEDGTVTLSSASFPSTGDPAWGNGQTPQGGWPWAQLSFPYRISQTTLIMQVPVFDSNGYPQLVPGAVVNIESVDTYVYQVLPDSAKPGQYLLQVAGFPGIGSTMKLTSTPQTILRGIVGPVDANGNIATFQYISRNNPALPATSVSDSAVSTISGLIMSVEVLRNGQGPQPTTVGLKTEVFMRNNAQATVIGS